MLNSSDNATANPPELPAPPVRLGRVSVICAIVIIIAFLAGFVPRWHQRGALRAETVKMSIPVVNVVAPAPGKAAAGLLLPAEVKPLVEAPIYARATGYLKRLLVDIGAHVAAGQLLAEIDTPELNQQLEQARAQLAEAEAALALAQTTAARWAELLLTSSVSEQEAAEKKADFQLKSATVEGARANVRRLEELRSFARVTAPFGGTITARNTDVGDLIAVNSGKELFHLAQTQTLRVYVHVPQTMARSITPDQGAEMTIPELPSRVFPAKIVRTSGAMAADSRTLLTELEVDNSQNEILAGSYAQVRFMDPEPDAALTIPATTLLFRAEGPQVGVVGPDGKIDLRNVTLGRDFGPVVEVLAGLRPTDRIVINPSDSLVSGTTVSIAEARK